jgi:hypothetical protein
MAATETTQSKHALAGTWRLVSQRHTDDKGEVHNLNKTGFLTYTDEGRFSVVIADTGREPIAHPLPLSAEEKARAFDTFHAYAGTYTFSGDKVIQHIEAAWIQNLVSTDQVRSVKLEGDRLTLRGGIRMDGVMYAANSELVWERVNPRTTDK